MSPSKQAAETEPLSYEAALAELESIVQRLDNSEVSVDELAPLVERATVLIHQCKALLASTNSRVAQAMWRAELDAVDARGIQALALGNQVVAVAGEGEAVE